MFVLQVGLALPLNHFWAKSPPEAKTYSPLPQVAAVRHCGFIL